MSEKGPEILPGAKEGKPIPESILLHFIMGESMKIARYVAQENKQELAKFGTRMEEVKENYAKSGASEKEVTALNAMADLIVQEINSISDDKTNWKETEETLLILMGPIYFLALGNKAQDKLEEFRQNFENMRAIEKIKKEQGGPEFEE